VGAADRHHPAMKITMATWTSRCRTQKGITGIQLDLKISGIDEAIIRATLAQSRERGSRFCGRCFDDFAAAGRRQRTALRVLVRTKIDSEKIGLLIGPAARTSAASRKTKAFRSTSKRRHGDDAGEDEASVRGHWTGSRRGTASVQVGRIYHGTVTSVKDLARSWKSCRARTGCVTSASSRTSTFQAWAMFAAWCDAMDVKVIAVDEQDGSS